MINLSRDLSSRFIASEAQDSEAQGSEAAEVSELPIYGRTF